MEHGHTHEEVPMPPAPRSVRVALGSILVPLAIATLIAMIVLWPGSPSPSQDTVVRIRGKVETTTPACPPSKPAMPGGPCGTATVRVKRTTGDEIVNATVPSGRTAPEIGPGDRVVLQSSG